MPVDLTARYNNAWFEVNTRLSLRQNAISVYATLMSFVVAGMGLYKPRLEATVMDLIFPCLVPILSLLFALLLFMHDRIICNLCKFIKACEVDGNNTNPPLPNYLTDSTWSASDDKIRVWHHVVCAALIVIFNCLAFMAENVVWPKLCAINSPMMWAQSGLTLIAIVFVLRTIRSK